MHTASIIAIYAVIVLIGGIIGYTSAKSTMSLAMAIPAAAILGYCAYLMSSKPVEALWGSLIVGVILDLVFTMRYVKTKKSMPAIPMMILSLGVVILSAMKLAHFGRA
jgi:uncharacterized membrane protein (UPF0136 family)